MTERVKEDWVLKAALVLMTIIVTSLGQTFLTSFQSSAMEEMNARIFRIEVALEGIAEDIRELKLIHARSSGTTAASS
jgi:hypothetical protein